MQNIIVKQLGLSDYQTVFAAMQTFTAERNEETADELWLTQHHPVFTQGQAGKPEHIFNTGDIPIIQSDRGGQVTYHGPGQIVLYFLIDIKRRKIGVRQMVTLMEHTVIDVLDSLGIIAFAKADAPGVYVWHNNSDKKIASLGLRIRRGCCYHGLALNAAMDLSPFERINPCGYQGLKMTQIKDVIPKQQPIDIGDIEQRLINGAQQHLRSHH
ncbi:MAG: octanoyltransferase [Gammaproteobacteria bacterium]|nr:MAG: octanoyltransferase [Gammaproteobacteria bacterium]